MPIIHRSQLHNDIITTAKIKDLQVTALKLADSAVTAAKLAPNSLTVPDVASAALTGVGIPVAVTFEIPNTAGDYDVVLPAKMEVYGMTTIKVGSNGGAGDSVTLKNLATAISNAVSLNSSVGALATASTMDPAQYTVSAGGTLRVTAAKVTHCGCHITVTGVIRA
tara:strand:+ start:1235 stop:1732 length:498 start_codon:yes stop_codon:yes gene_type:complete